MPKPIYLSPEMRSALGQPVFPTSGDTSPDPERSQRSAERLGALAGLLQTVPGVMAQLGYTSVPLERGLRFWAANDAIMLGVLSYESQRKGFVASVHVVGEGQMDILDKTRGTIGTGTLVVLGKSGQLLAARGALQCRDLDNRLTITQLPKSQGVRFAPVSPSADVFLPEVLDDIYERLVLRLPGMTDDARERLRDACAKTDRAVLQPILRALLLRPDAKVREWALRTIMSPARTLSETPVPERTRGRGRS